MVSQEVLKYKGETLMFYQCVNKEEAQKEKLPDGLYFYWKLGKQKITSPFEAVQIYLKATADEQSAIHKLIVPHNLAKHYKNLHKVQMETIKNSMQQAKKSYEKTYIQSGMSKQAVTAMQEMADKQINQLDSLGFPGLDGLFKPTRQQAEVLLGKENMDKIIPKETQRKLFNE